MILGDTPIISSQTKPFGGEAELKNIFGRKAGTGIVLYLVWVGFCAKGVALNAGWHLKQPKNISNNISKPTATD